MSEFPKEVIDALNVITDYISNQTGDDELSFVGATYEVLDTGKEFDVVVQDKSEFRKLKETASEMYEFIETYMGGHPEAEEILAKARGDQND